MKISQNVTDLWDVQEFLKKKSKGHWKLGKDDNHFCVGHIQIPIILHEDIMHSK